jgi:hypothetical protein
MNTQRARQQIQSRSMLAVPAGGKGVGINSKGNETVRPCGLSQNGCCKAQSGLWRSRALLQGEGLPRPAPLLMTMAAVMAGLLNLQAATVTGESSASAYTVSGTDLLQTHLGAADDALSLNAFERRRGVSP